MRGKWIGVLVVVLAIAAASTYIVRQRRSLPAPDSPKYEETTRNFYRGLASLQVGLLDDAKREFTRTTELVPSEPAGWADLGLAHLRLGDFDPALRIARPVECRHRVAARSTGIVARRPRSGHADFRRAVELEPDNLRARF